LDEVVDEFRFISNGEKGVERNSPEVGRWIEEHNIVISKRVNKMGLTYTSENSCRLSKC